MPTVLISAGDVSGDRHAAELATALRARVPGVRLLGLGGEALAKVDFERVADQADLALGGFVEWVAGARGALRCWRRMTAAIEAQRPDLVVLVDAGGFNLPLARRVKRLGDTPVLYYVAPQVWAWRPGRLRKIAARTDRVAVIHPFEPALYREHGIRADFVGHPLVDELARFRAGCDRDQARRRLGLDPARRWLTLLPGSRHNEVERHLPIALAAATRVHGSCAELGLVIALAPPIDAGRVASIVRDARLPDALRPVIVRDRVHEAIRAAECVVAKPGTVTVEAMLLERPMVVIGRANPLSAALARRLLHVRWLAMPNLLAGAPIVPELLQTEATPARVAAALVSLLDPRAAARQCAALAVAAEALGPGGAAARASAIAEAMLGDRAA